MASGDGRVVAAVHAGWRGLARGVISSAVQALRQRKGDRMDAVAVLGPHVGPCCYEVDRPVLGALSPRFGERLQHALSPTRRGHWRLDLGTLARFELIAAGLASERIGAVPEACTACDPHRFHSYRRDGPKAGRLIHFVRVRRQA
jgi:copper oxidase (laccase) domain-containing protein